MILGKFVIALVDGATFVGVPLPVVRVWRPVALAVTLLRQETPRHPASSTIFPTIFPNKDLVQVLPVGFGLRMKMFSVLWILGTTGFSPFVVGPHFQIQSAAPPPPPSNF